MGRMRKVRCPQCGAENYPTDEVCLSCGANLLPPRPQPPAPPIQTAPDARPDDVDVPRSLLEDIWRIGSWVGWIGCLVSVMIQIGLPVVVLVLGLMFLGDQYSAADLLIRRLGYAVATGGAIIGAVICFGLTRRRRWAWWAAMTVLGVFIAWSLHVAPRRFGAVAACLCFLLGVGGALVLFATRNRFTR